MDQINEKYELREIRKFCVEIAIRMFDEGEERRAETLISIAADVEKFILQGEAVDEDGLRPGAIVYKRD